MRIHDAGDFHSDPYTAAWLRIIRATKDVTFYAYTKEVARFKRMVEPSPPQNFKWVYSYGGQQDSLIDERTDRVADIFPSYEAMAAEGYSSQDESDLQAIYNKNPRVGIPYNNIPHMKKILAGRTFREWQQSVDLFRASKKEGADHNPNAPGRYATCLCGAPFSGKPAPGCNRFGHAVHTKNNAGEEQDLFNQQEDIKRMMEMAVQTKDGISIFDCCDQCDACLTDGEKESGKRLCGFCNEEALRANEGVG